MRVYIAGAITGRPTEEYMTQFKEAEEKLWNAGYETINPAKIGALLPDTFTHDDYMDADRVLLSKCDAIHMLTGWETSEGARRELIYALEHGYDVVMLAS